MVQRVEVITGKERRRRWSDEEKSRLVAACCEPGAIVAHVARRHGVAESCLYSWIKGMKRANGGELPQLLPVSIAGAAATEPFASPSVPTDRPAVGRAVIVLSDGTRLEIDAGYPAGALRTLIGALRLRG